MPRENRSGKSTSSIEKRSNRSRDGSNGLLPDEHLKENLQNTAENRAPQLKRKRF